MSWQELNKMDLRKEFVLLALSNNNISALCLKFNISRKTGYKWLKRYHEFGLEGLYDKAKSPHSSPKKTDPKIEQIILEVKRKYLAWGGRKIRAYLINQGMLESSLPSCFTVSKILKRNGYIHPFSERAKREYIRFEHDSPNRLWQMDYKGDFKMERERCYPLTILDDHSRYNICLKACSNQQRLTVQEELINKFKRYGLPERINVDNGNPWGNSIKGVKYTQLSVWLMDLGVAVSYSRPRHPQTNGKLERFHRTLKEELLKSSYIRDISHAQCLFDEWRDFYNSVRPHESLDNRSPIDSYSPSYREYSDKIRDYEYSSDYGVKNVISGGRIYIRGQDYRIGEAFIGKKVAIKEESEGKIEVYYKRNKIKTIALRSNVK